MDKVASEFAFIWFPLLLFLGSKVSNHFFKNMTSLKVGVSLVEYSIVCFYSLNAH